MGDIKSVTNRNHSPLREFAAQCGAAAATASVMSMALLGIFAAIRVNVDLPFAANQPVTTVIASASTMLAAYIAGIKRRRTGLVLGASVGLAVFALIAAASAVIAAQPASQQIFVKLIALISSGGIGGMAGVSKSFNKKKIKRP